MNCGVVSEEIKHKEGLDKKNKSLKKTIKLRADTLLIPPLGTSPQLLQLLVEDSSVGVGAMVEEFEEVMEHEAEVVAMVDALVESEEEPLTNNLDAVEELYEAWDLTLDTLPVEGNHEDWYNGGGFV